MAIQNKLRTLVGACMVTGAVVSAPSFAAVNVDDDGFGFIGKGDVQLALNWNNKQLQDCVGTSGDTGCLEFQVNSQQVTTWTCTKDSNGNTQERTNTTTQGGLFAIAARVKNQVTGFNLGGFTNGAPDSVTQDGPEIGSCPTYWTAGETSTQSIGGSGIEVRANGGAWTPIE